METGSAGSSAATRMVAVHEASHAFLNASTTYGLIMQAAGALADAGFDRFGDLVEILISRSVETHETYATNIGLGANVSDQSDQDFLSNYLGYGRFLERFTDAFGDHTQTHREFALIALSSASRVAMQLDLIDWVAVRAFDDWFELAGRLETTPDARFATALTVETCERAVTTILGLARTYGPDWEPIINGKTDRVTDQQFLADADVKHVDRLYEASYNVFAAAIAGAGDVSLEYDAQRSFGRDLAEKLKAYAGDRLKSQFITPGSHQDDVGSALSDLRRERLSISPKKIKAVLGDAQEVDDATCLSIFAGTGANAHYQVVAMPSKKAAFTYNIQDRADLLEPSAKLSITGFRRRISYPDGSAVVEYLILSRDRAASLIEKANDVPVVFVVSSSVLSDKTWFSEWVTQDDGTDRVFVLVDTDPFAQLDILSAREEDILFARLRLTGQNDPSQSSLWAYAFLSKSEPHVLYFSPCSGALVNALSNHAEHMGKCCKFGDGFLKDWSPHFNWVMGHVLAEEIMFGDRFWEG
ncbi:MAG: hypothetical protein AAGL99_18340 [Pseudomonadota bacterium]